MNTISQQMDDSSLSVKKFFVLGIEMNSNMSKNELIETLIEYKIAATVRRSGTTTVLKINRGLVDQIRFLFKDEKLVEVVEKVYHLTTLDEEMN